MIAIVRILIKIADWLGTYLGDIARWFGKWFRGMWIGLSALTFIMYNLVNQLITHMSQMFTKISTATDAEWPSTVSTAASFLNSIVPLKEAIQLWLLLWTISIAGMTYRFIKSWILGVS